MKNIPEQFNVEEPAQHQSQTEGKKASIFGTLIITLFLFLCSGVLQLLFVIPLFVDGMLSLEMFELPQHEFSQALGSTGEALLTLAGMVATLICVKIALTSENITFASLGFQFKNYQKDTIAGAFAGIAIMTACFILLVTTDYISFTANKFSQVPWLASIVLFLSVAISEEVLCRGYIQGRLMRASSPYLALLISSILFMALHLGNDNWTLISLLNLTLAGIIFGLYYLHTQNLWFPIALHFTWNFFQGPVLGFQVSGGEFPSWLVLTKSNNPLITGGKFGLEGSLLITTLQVLLIILIQLRFSPPAKKKTDDFVEVSNPSTP